MVSSREQTAQERLAICASCRHLIRTFKDPRIPRCAVCGCFLELKTRLLSESCPIGRWSSTRTGVLDSLREIFR